jgi:hypothetical protein
LRHSLVASPPDAFPSAFVAPGTDSWDFCIFSGLQWPPLLVASGRQHSFAC